ncbi:hypothetical protein [Streptomyces sp. TRM68416]|uniref:hypothetical protein n=1 Tax=Streptomyces sp. TRM68416 TaxID=2758412 RepID=UPI001661CA9D|nr:hypothetical protein [Streptomyces sp. TRM68416]MBD0837399.1 hypothetical protein [Streptomyces sp. TRM68416]
MSARESSVRQAQGVGKDTGGGLQPSAGGVHPDLALPHLPYGDAVHAELTASGLEPDVVEAGVRREPGCTRELFLTVSWSPGHADLDREVWPDGLTLAWSHLTGWSTHDGDTVRTLDDDLDDLAPPVLIADAVLHLAVHGLHVPWVPPVGGRWVHADGLDAALDAFAEREVNR